MKVKAFPIHCILLINNLSFDDVFKNESACDGQMGSQQRLEPVRGKARVVCLIGES